MENQNGQEDLIQVAEIVEDNVQPKQILTITEAARINGVTRQAIYVAIKQGKLKAQKEFNRWTIRLEDLEEYRRTKYSRSKSMHNGELIFDHNKGYYSVNQAAKVLKVPAQKIYYATRIGLLKATRKGAAWVIHMDDIKEYEENYLRRQRAMASQIGINI